ncbi:deoxynucleoside kinase [Candidatus Gracilibacteria bacterium]|nr:deoxynucleoside kinase [Candidatus Gracilibacteria bacterium]
MNIIETNDYGSIINLPDIEMTLKDFLKYNKRNPVIAFTGPAGIGKSTISKQVAELLGAKLYTELPELNPCLKVIKGTGGKVNDITLWGNNQNFFLSTDVAQIIKAFIHSKKFPIVFDFALTQTLIFSDIKLKGKWLETFNDMFKLQFKSLPKPDIVIELQADNSVIIKRLNERGGKHIDEHIIKMIETINHYYNSGIVPESYQGETSRVLQIQNNVSVEETVKNILYEIKKKV